MLNRRVLTVALEGDLAAPAGDASRTRSPTAGVYTPERRAFRPHVTVARLRGRARRATDGPRARPPLTFHGAAVTLYASRLLPDGARYEALATASLAAL